MSEAFLRKYKLTIGSFKTGAVASVIENLHIEFDVDLTSEKKANTAEIRIYNMADKTIALLEEKDAVVNLEAGYESGSMGLIFRGIKTHMVSRKEGPDRVTIVQASDGGYSFREGRINFSLPKGSSLRDVISNIISKGFVGMSKNLKGDILDEKIYNSGYSGVGSAAHALDVVCKANGLEWNLLNNVMVNVYPIKDGQKTQAEAVLLNPNSGLINIPEKLSQEVKQLKKDLKMPKDNGIKAKSVLNHRLVAGTFVKLEGTTKPNSRTGLDGIYKIKRVTHRGSFEGSEWITEIEAVQI